MAELIEWDERELATLARDDYVRRDLAEHAGQVAALARASAPRRTGAGAASIRGEAVLDDGQWTARVSWDQLHAYMRFPDYVASKHSHPSHFLEHALDRYARP